MNNFNADDRDVLTGMGFCWREEASLWFRSWRVGDTLKVEQVHLDSYTETLVLIVQIWTDSLSFYEDDYMHFSCVRDLKDHLLLQESS